MATNSDVAEAWGRSRRKVATNMSTDGVYLYSYELLIGYTAEDGKKVLIDYTAAGGRFVSMTTSTKHISPSRWVADTTVSADDYDAHGEDAHNPPLMEEPELDPHHAINGET